MLRPAANLQEAAALIANILAVDPLIIDSHVRGLRAAGRLKDSNAGPFECADILCCVLSTDQGNATAPYHLPLSGIATGISLIDSQDPEFDPFNMTFGEMVAALLSGDQIAARAAGISVRGAGCKLSGGILLAPPGGDDPLRLVYGYNHLPDMPALRPAPELESSYSAGGEVIDRLRDMLAPESRRLRASMFRQAYVANTPLVPTVWAPPTLH